MRLWKLTQTANCDYDTYDSVIVAAESEADAITIHPRSERNDDFDVWKAEREDGYYSWAPGPEDVFAAEIGTAAPNIMRGVILASFNAG